jgi:hypothetical protein
MALRNRDDFGLEREAEEQKLTDRGRRRAQEEESGRKRLRKLLAHLVTLISFERCRGGLPKVNAMAPISYLPFVFFFFIKSFHKSLSL